MERIKIVKEAATLIAVLSCAYAGAVLGHGFGL